MDGRPMSDELSYKIERTPINLTVGNYVKFESEHFKISELIDFDQIIGISTSDGRAKLLRIKELSPIEENSSPSDTVDLQHISDPDWQVAQKRYSIIKTLLEFPQYGRHEVTKVAEQHDINTATLYRWIKRFNTSGNIISLVPKKRGVQSGDWRIEHEKESLIQEVIQDYYLTKQKVTVQATVDEVKRICHLRNIEPPSPSTVRKRILAIPEKESLWRRGQKEKSKNKFTPTAGQFPNADYPLAVVQIDHTPADIILVDDEHRLPLGRPWITLAMDINTRMVVGYFLSFDPPSETSLSMCVSHMVIPKEDWLILHNVNADWPVWGFPRTIHVDNGADFRSNNFKKSCATYGINLEFRPVKTPRYGGHVERLLGTLLKEIHKLPGTTFSSIKDRDEYDSDKNAALTKSEFEEWLVNLICRVYHQKEHTSLGMSPIKKWEIGIFGSNNEPGIGMPPRHNDKQKLMLDFLPVIYRTVQSSGIQIDKIFYYSEALRPWINAEDPVTNKKRKFIFRRDPRDISVLWFFDPELKQYFRIPYADQSLPSMSLWELEIAKKKLKEQGNTSANEAQILNALTYMREIINEASQKTKKARRQRQKQTEYAKKLEPTNPLKSKIPIKTSDSAALVLLDNIDSFTDIS